MSRIESVLGQTNTSDFPHLLTDCNSNLYFYSCLFASLLILHVGSTDVKRVNNDFKTSSILFTTSQRLLHSRHFRHFAHLRHFEFLPRSLISATQHFRQKNSSCSQTTQHTAFKLGNLVDHIGGHIARPSLPPSASSICSSTPNSNSSLPTASANG